MKIKVSRQLLFTLAIIFSSPAVAIEGGLGLKVSGLQFHELELRHGESDERILSWDGEAFYGDDELRWRLLTEGEHDVRKSITETTETRLVAQRPASEFFYTTAGVRFDTSYEFENRWLVGVGTSGLAPQWFEVDVDLFISETSAASVRFAAEYELLFVNKIYSVFSFETNYAFAADESAGVGNRLNDIEIGIRLHYDLIHHRLVPYIGVFHENRFADTANFHGTRDANFIVVGLQLLF